MEPLLIDLAFYGVVGVVALLALGLPAWKVIKMRRAANEPLRDDICVACNSEQVVMLAPGVYRCNQCGFTGGSGMAAYQQQLKRQQDARMTPGQAVAGAVKDLRQARMELLGVHGLLQDATTSSTMDLVGIGNMDRGRAKHSSLGAAVRQMQVAASLVEDASGKLRVGQIFSEDIGVDFASPDLILDTSFLADNVLVNVAVHVRIEKIRAQSRRMMAAIDDALRRLEAVPAAGGRPA